MALQTGSWRVSDVESLLDAVQLLLRTVGVREITIKPGSLTYLHDASARIDLLPPAGIGPSWFNRLETLDLREFSSSSLLSGLVGGWEHLRKIGKHPTHLIVWDRNAFLRSAFPRSGGWVRDPQFEDSVFGMQVVDLSESLLNEGTVVLVGGPVADGTPDHADVGLLLRWNGEEG